MMDLNVILVAKP